MMEGAGKTVSMNKLQLFFLAITISTLILLAGVVYFSYEKKSIQEEKRREIKAIATLKINQISAWQRERTGDVESVLHATYFIRAIGSWFSDTSNSVIKSAISSYITNISSSLQYKEILLTTPDGRTMLTSLERKGPPEPVATSFITQAIKEKKIVISDFYFSPDGKQICFDVIGPLFDEQQRPVAALVYRIDPEVFLFPYIRAWPAVSKTSETILLRKSGDSVLFLNDARHLKGTALKLRIRLTETEVPSVQAVRGYSGIFEGKDYRGVEVLSWVGPVTGTPWYMVAKIDKQELYADLVTHAILISIIIFIMILMVVIVLAWIYSSKQKNIYRKLFLQENRLRESQEQFKTTLYSIGDAVITTDMKGMIRQMNPVAEKLTGWKEKEASGQYLESVFRIVDEYTRQPIENPMNLVLKQGTVVGIANHTLLISKDGMEIPVADSGAPILNERKEITGVVVVFRDQTAERKAREILAESERRYRTFINTSHDMIFIKDDRMQYIVVNDRLVDFFGLDREKILGKTDFDLMNEAGALNCKKSDEIALQKMTLVVNEEEINGRIYETNKFPLLLSDKKTGIGGFIRDVTDVKRLLSDLTDAKNRAEENDRLKTAFLNNLSHEIRTPLNGIVGFSELIVDPAIDEKERARFGKIVKNNSDRLLSIITDIISIATIEAGQETLRATSTDINLLLNDLCQHYRMILNAGQVEISFTSTLSGEEARVLTDGTKLAQVISNLVGNAIKFTEKGSIEVECTRKSQWLHFSVTDTGIGIPEQYQQIIFERFRQVDNDKEIIYRGNGLGLAISKAYVELMGGTIGVRSEPAKGSCFYFSIPYQTVMSEIPVEEHTIKPKNDFQTMEKDSSATEKLLLIAEDEESNYILTEKMLAPYPYRIIHVTNGQAAINQCLENPDIDMALMDLKMPGVNGYEATRRIRELRPDMPIVAVTAYALSGDREKAIAAGCDDYLAKPFERQDLVAMIEKFPAKPR